MFSSKGLLFFVVLFLLVFAGEAAAGPNANAVLSLDLIADGGVGNQTDDGVISGTISGQGTKIAVEVFAKGVTTAVVGARIEFDFDASVLKFERAQNNAFVLTLPEVAGTNFISSTPVTLPESGFLARAEFMTVADVTGKKFSLGIKAVTLRESLRSSDVVTTTNTISFYAAPSPDFDGDGVVGIPDFLLFVNNFGSRQGDGTYQAKYDLDGNGAIEISDFLIFIDNFGKEVPSSNRGGDDPTPVSIPDANLRAVIAESLGKARGATITRGDMSTLTRLIALDVDISDLTGLESAINLHSLNLRNNTISDISSLSGLTKLTWLSLGSNSISDVTPLSNLTNLTELSLFFNTITDITPLSSLTNLKVLSLPGNTITDITPLSGLTSLRALFLDNNTIMDLSPLLNLTNLRMLTLLGTSISNIAPLSGLTNLTSLDLSRNTISDVSALSNLTNLITLILSSNSLSDVSALSNLTNLITLILSSNTISDLSLLVANTGLGSGDWVDVRNNPLSATSINTHIPALQDRGVTVRF